MTTSTVITTTRGEILRASMRKLNVIGEGEIPSADTLSNFAFGFNCLLQEWGSEGCPLWKITEIIVPLFANVGSYQIGPTATGTGAVVGDRPLRIIDSSFVRDSSGLDTTLTILSRQEYNQLGLKSTPSTVTQVYYDPQLNNGVLKTYGISSDSTHVAHLTAQIPIYSMTADADIVNLPQEGYKAAIYGLADDMMEEYPVYSARPEQRIIQKAEAYREKLMAFSQEESSIFFMPSPSIRHR